MKLLLSFEVLVKYPNGNIPYSRLGRESMIDLHNRSGYGIMLGTK